jgi:large subunit ribosomal protein L18
MRRRREGRTDYAQRLRLLKSGDPRLVARISNRHATAQIERPGATGDETLAAAHSADLEAFGWEAPTSNLPSAYLTGLLVGGRAAASGVERAVLDIGLRTPTPGAKVFAVQEGAIDGGLTIPHDESVLPDWERNRGEHVAAYAEDRDEPLYGGDFDAVDLPGHFDETREAILDAIEEGDL